MGSETPSSEQTASIHESNGAAGKTASRSLLSAAEKVSMPQVLICRASATDISTGNAATFFDHWIPVPAKGAIKSDHVLSPLGRRICVLDERFPHGAELTALVHSFDIPYEYDTGTTLRLWHESIKEWFAKHEWTAEELAQCNGIIAWLRRDAVQVLEIGNAQANIATNRLRVKNFTSLDGAREFLQDRIKSRIQKHVTKRDLVTKENWSWTLPNTFEMVKGDAGEEAPVEMQVSCRFEEHLLNGATRCIFLASDVWLPTDLDVLFRAGKESSGSAGKACEELRQSFGVIGQRPRGSVAVVNILPQELDTPDVDNVIKNARRAQRAFKGSKAVAGGGKGAAGIAGKLVVGALIVAGVFAVGAVIRTMYERYHEPKNSRADLDRFNASPANAEAEPFPTTPTDAVSDTASVNPYDASNADTLGLKPQMKQPVGKEVFFNEEFYRRNREKLLRGDFKEVPFIVKEFPTRFISFSGQQTTFIPIAIIRASLFNAENIHVEIFNGSPSSLPKTALQVSPQAAPQIASAKSTPMPKSSPLAKASTLAKNLVKKSPFDGLFRIDRQPQATSATKSVLGKVPNKASNAAAYQNFAQNSTSANSKNAVPKSTMPKPPQIQQVTRYGILFDKPLAVGRYTIKLYHTEKGKADTSVCEWRVIETPFTAPSLKSMKSAKFYYGKPLALRAKLVSELQDFYSTGANNFRIRYQFGVENPHTTLFTPNTWTGPNIPAFAQKMNVEIVWMDTLSNYTVPLFAREIQPEQTPPDILCEGARAESDDAEAPRKTPNSKKPVPPPNFQVAIKNLAVDFEVPIDADNKDAAKSKTVRATLADVASDAPASIDYTSADTRLGIYIGEEPDPKASWSASATTFSVVKGDYDPKTGTFPLVIQVSNLPPKPPAETRLLRGTIAVLTNAKIVNRLAGTSAKSQAPPCVIPINIQYK